MKSFIQYITITLLIFICSASLYSQNCNNLEDPLFSYDPNLELDLCCGMTFNTTVCYSMTEVISMWGYPSTAEPFSLMVFYTPGGGVPVTNFSSFSELANYMTQESQNNGINANFIWDPAKETICAENPDNAGNFGVLCLCDDPVGTTSCNIDMGWHCIDPDLEAGECPITLPDVNAMISDDPPANITIFDDGNGGTLSTDGIISGSIPSDPAAPSINTVGNIINAIKESGALDYGAGCFNLNCLDVGSMADGLNQGQIATEINNYGNSQGETNLSATVSAGVADALADIDLISTLNSLLGLNIPDLGPCPPDDVISFSGLPPLWNNGDPESGSPPPPGTEADQNYFSQTIPGLGLEGPGSAMPSPSAMENVQSVDAGVDMYNGSQSASIPLYTIQSNDISIPISLSSTTNGLKVNEMGTLVGQNWNLIASNMISRVVKGLPDEYYGYTTGVGVGKRPKIGPRFEFPSNMGLKVTFPGSKNVLCPEDIYSKAKSGIELFDADFGKGLGNADDLPIQFSGTWSPLNPTVVNFTIGIPVFQIPFFGVIVYWEIGFNAGVAPNEKIDNILYEEEGIGFLHLDDPQAMATFGLAFTNPTDILLHTIPIEEQLKALKKVHAHKRIEDTKFFSDKIAHWDNWIQSLKKEVKYKTQRMDTEPDEFYFNIEGYSGYFSFNIDGTPILFGNGVEELEVLPPTIATFQGQDHIASFVIRTPNGMEYTFGAADFYAVDMSKDTNYYLPNLYTYEELNTNREEFGDAQIDVAVMTNLPFFGSKKAITYGNTYNRNYKISESPEYSSAWHLVSVRSLLTQEQVSYRYEERELTYYSDKNYTHTFPNFDVENGKLKTNKNTDLNPIHYDTTKWENGQAEFAYSVTQSQLRRWHVTDIITSRGETAHFLYNYPRGEIAGDRVCNRIEVHRNNNLYKGWELIYNTPETVASSAGCDPVPTENPAPPPIDIDEETVFDLGDLYDMRWFEYNGYFILSFRLGCLYVPIRISFPYIAGIKDFGYRTQLSEYGSLMEVKALNGLYNESKEEAIFNAEKKRTFLIQIKEIDRFNGDHDFVSIEYNDPETLPKKYHTDQDLFGYLYRQFFVGFSVTKNYLYLIIRTASRCGSGRR